jgi:hypothetical protein
MAHNPFWFCILDKERFKAEIFRKIEPHLTSLNIPQLERQGVDIQTKVEELHMLNQSLRNRDRLKGDAITQLSDQVINKITRNRKETAANMKYISPNCCVL